MGWNLRGEGGRWGVWWDVKGGETGGVEGGEWCDMVKREGGWVWYDVNGGVDGGMWCE